MGFNCGIVGLPNVGKSTLFNALTKAKIGAENYPFCTIDPNVGRVAVPDPRLDQLASIIKPQAIIPTHMEFVDIAGLVAGASKGEGLGNQFLANIRETDAIVHVVRCFENDDIIHVAGQVRPRADIETISTELMLADMETVEKSLQRQQKNTQSGNKEAIAWVSLLEKIREVLNKGQSIRMLSFTPEEHLKLKSLNLLTAKPTLYIANVSETGFTNNPLLDEVRELATAENAAVVPISAAIEAELADMDDEEKTLFLQEMGLEEPGLYRLIRAGHELLGLQTYFTAGVKEVRAWTVHKGATAPEAAGVIHTDFEKGFIRAEVIAFEDFVRFGGEQGAKEAGKWRLEGKDYIVKDGDIMHFRFNV